MTTSQNKAQLEQTIDQQKQRMLELMAERDEAQNQRDEVTLERDLLQASLLDTSWERTDRKPMRLRILELPGEIDPQTRELSTPFVFVLDRVPDDADPEALKLGVAKMGASGLLVFAHEVQLGEDPIPVEISPHLHQSAGQPLPAEIWPGAAD